MAFIHLIGMKPAEMALIGYNYCIICSQWMWLGDGIFNLLPCNDVFMFHLPVYFCNLITYCFLNNFVNLFLFLFSICVCFMQK